MIITFQMIRISSRGIQLHNYYFLNDKKFNYEVFNDMVTTFLIKILFVRGIQIRNYVIS